MVQPIVQHHPQPEATPTPQEVDARESDGLYAGRQVLVVWGSWGKWGAWDTTPASVVFVTPETVLLEGKSPHRGFPAVGAPVQLKLVPHRKIVEGRLAAYGRADRYLLSLGSRGLRRSPRGQMDVPATVWCDLLVGPAQVRLVDLSRGGARLRGIRLPVEAELQLVFTPPGSQQLVTLPAVVVRIITGSGPPEVGLALRLGSCGRRLDSGAAAPSIASPPPSAALPLAVQPVAPAVQFVAVVGSRASGAAGVTVQTRPNALCSISYVTPAGTPSAAQGLRAQQADATGRVSWAWSLSPNTEAGTAVVTVNADGVSASTLLELA